jgi:hypothetical protein
MAASPGWPPKGPLWRGARAGRPEHGWQIVAKNHARSGAPVSAGRAGECAGAGGGDVQGPHRTRGARRVSLHAAVGQGVVIAVVVRGFGRLCLGVDGGPLHRAPVGRDGIVRRAHVFRTSPTAGKYSASAARVKAHRRWLGPVRLNTARQIGRGWAYLDAGRPPGIPATAVKTVGTQHRITASPKRYFVAPHAVTGRHGPTNTPHITSYGLDWPFRCTSREKRPTASRRRRRHNRAWNIL